MRFAAHLRVFPQHENCYIGSTCSLDRLAESVGLVASDRAPSRIRDIARPVPGCAQAVQHRLYILGAPKPRPTAQRRSMIVRKWADHGCPLTARQRQ